MAVLNDRRVHVALEIVDLLERSGLSFSECIEVLLDVAEAAMRVKAKSKDEGGST